MAPWHEHFQVAGMVQFVDRRLGEEVVEAPPHTIYTRIGFAEQLPPGGQVNRHHMPNAFQAFVDEIGQLLVGFAFIEVSDSDFPWNGIAKVDNEKHLSDMCVGQ